MSQFKKIFTTLTILLFTLYSVWWVWLFFFVSPDSSLRDYFTDSYGVIAGFGAIIGLYVSTKWGGLKSLVGRSLVFFSLGLLCQFLGQISYSIEFYIYHIANSYPSYGEAFYLSSIPLYVLGVWSIAKASGISITLKDYRNKIGAILFPLCMVGFSYYFFIKGTPFNELDLNASILSFAYPIGQAIFVSLAILTYLLTSNILGGVMRKRVVFILFSLIFQYAADSTFLYKTIQESWYPADISEYMFVVSYVLMTLAFIQFFSILETLKNSD